MKKQFSALKKVFFFLAIVFAVKPATGKLTRDEVVKIYIDATISGSVGNLNNVLADDMQFDIQRGKNLNTLDKNQLIDYLKNNTTSGPSVKTTTTVMQEDDSSAVIKVEFKYDGYSRTDEVTLNKTFGWEITKVVSKFM